MEIPKGKFVTLVKKAINIDEAITQRLADEFKVSISTLERWSEGESVPPNDVRLTVLQRITGIMLGVLGHITIVFGDTK